MNWSTKKPTNPGLYWYSHVTGRTRGPAQAVTVNLFAGTLDAFVVGNEQSWDFSDWPGMKWAAGVWSPASRPNTSAN